jgi:hypothetical protein
METSSANANDGLWQLPQLMLLLIDNRLSRKRSLPSCHLSAVNSFPSGNSISGKPSGIDNSFSEFIGETVPLLSSCLQAIKAIMNPISKNCFII